MSAAEKLLERQAGAVRARLGSVKAVAARLDVSERAVWKWLASGRMIRPLRLGRAVRFDLAELDRWIDAGCPALERWEAMQGGER